MEHLKQASYGSRAPVHGGMACEQASPPAGKDDCLQSDELKTRPQSMLLAQASQPVHGGSDEEIRPPSLAARLCCEMPEAPEHPFEGFCVLSCKRFAQS